MPEYFAFLQRSLKISFLFLAVAVFLLWNLIIGLQRTLIGPTAADRMVSAQFFTTKSIAILLLLAHVSKIPALRDVALVFALLAIITTIAFVEILENS